MMLIILVHEFCPPLFKGSALRSTSSFQINRMQFCLVPYDTLLKPHVDEEGDQIGSGFADQQEIQQVLSVRWFALNQHRIHIRV
ncbi:hypothetical protein FGO68_gene12271 [Halteria grandinella]|uniref:Uncharacterized protein n=1 Tax=Halteria grandinella TaxID=5974 RepID=A0A8J8NVF3_HALGN|nr:hypothetical protein FGO68_gene12271 [Halteria grandinella]